jgi:hypothetical protein
MKTVSGEGSPHSTVGKFVAGQASDFKREQQLSTSGMQKVQYQ